MSRALVALRHRNYRLLWLGLGVSMAGTMMRNAALLWHISLLVPPGQKAIALGAMGLVRAVPIVFGSLVAGVAADAFDRRRLLLVTNSVMMAVSCTLAAITLLGLARPWLVYALAGIGAVGGAFDNPARNAFFPTLVPREHLPNAIGLNSIVFQAASVLGPSLGGVIIGYAGIAPVYVLDAASFVVLIGSLLAMRDLPARSSSPTLRLGPRAAWEGVRFVFGHSLLRSSMLLDFFASFFASATALMPIYAQDILHVGAHGYGLLASASAAGAVLSSVVMVPLLERIERRGRVLLAVTVAYGLGTVGFGLSKLFWLSFACLFFAGAADMVSTVLRNVIRQLVTPDEMRGRMASVSMIFFLGGPQLGELEAGAVAQAFGPVASVVSGGVACVLTVLLVGAREPALASYRRELPEPANS